MSGISANIASAGLDNIEEYHTIEQLVRNVDEITAAITRVSARVDALPADLNRAIDHAAEEIESSQPGIRATLKEGRGIVDATHATIRDANTALDKVQETGVWVEKTAAHATEAGKAWEGTVKEVNRLVEHFDDDPDAPQPTEPSPPFDMKDVARTAEEATKTATEVHASVVELRAIVEGDGLDKRLESIEKATKSTLEGTTAAVASLIDTITIRAALLILLFFGSLLSYRFAAGRLVKNRS